MHRALGGRDDANERARRREPAQEGAPSVPRQRLKRGERERERHTHRGEREKKTQKKKHTHTNILYVCLPVNAITCYKNSNHPSAHNCSGSPRLFLCPLCSHQNSLRFERVRSFVRQVRCGPSSRTPASSSPTAGSAPAPSRTPSACGKR